MDCTVYSPPLNGRPLLKHPRGNWLGSIPTTAGICPTSFLTTLRGTHSKNKNESFRGVVLEASLTGLVVNVVEFQWKSLEGKIDLTKFHRNFATVFITYFAAQLHRKHCRKTSRQHFAVNFGAKTLPHKFASKIRRSTSPNNQHRSATCTKIPASGTNPDASICRCDVHCPQALVLGNSHSPWQQLFTHPFLKLQIANFRNKISHQLHSATGWP